ncbi:BofC C-terminal domain-containing protein [Paenibacillus sp. SYP-B4298]|uniref:BofC C-terminal domain-containing protein n=1 Tax=Paenibacillus sp. SYP-B4298 TaxID=2996034 RepID=UPI0022DE56A8|nr:BofC C-terminal domain-containing protein [Paenibacillus sp. SYP-B4298]
MLAFNLWKKLKRRLRKGRRPLWALGGLGLLLFLAPIVLMSQPTVLHAAQQEDEYHQQGRAALARMSDDGVLKVVLRKQYVCGEEASVLGKLSAVAITKLLDEHPHWTIQLKGQEEALLTEKIEDLAEDCKGKVFFSLDKLGNFTLFEGPPAEEKVMRTFFQLDMSYMESSLPKEQLQALAKGIRICDVDEYHSMLSSYSEFAMRGPRSKRVMNSTHHD